MGGEKTLTSHRKPDLLENENSAGQKAITLGVGACELSLVCLKRPTRCSPEVVHKFLLWLYKSCCCNPASGGRSGWPWTWREPPVSLQGPVNADSNVVSVSDYFHTDNYGVLMRRTACHHKSFCAKGENCVNIHHELASVCGDSALDYSNVNRWMAKFKKGRVSSTDLPRPGRPCSSRTERTCWKSHSEWLLSYGRGYLCSYRPNPWDSDENH